MGTNDHDQLKRRIDVVGAALVRDGKLLAARRGGDMELPGMWEFPGGKIEDGETHQQALARELSEELQCEVLVGAHIDTTEYEYEFGIVTLSVYHCTLVSGEPQVTEHAEIRWLAPDELDEVKWAPADVPAVRWIQSEGRTFLL